MLPATIAQDIRQQVLHYLEAVRAIFDGVMKASEIAGHKDKSLEAIRKTLTAFPAEKLVKGALANALG